MLRRVHLRPRAICALQMLAMAGAIAARLCVLRLVPICSDGLQPDLIRGPYGKTCQNINMKQLVSTLKLLQITDTHLFPDTDQTLLGINTWHSLQAVLQHLQGDPHKPDHVLISGDLVQQGHNGAYELFKQAMRDVDAPLHCLPGNHDHPDRLHAAMGAAATQVVDCGAWRLILLDTSVRGSEGGHLAPDQLELLREAASVQENRHVLVSMHHNPIPMGSAWLDTMQIDNSDELLACIEKLPHVRALVWGHVHQAHDSWLQRKNSPPVRMLSSPSTCFQFLPGSSGFGLDTAMPGYRWLFLHADGSLDTQVIRIASLPTQAGTPQMSSAGY